MKGSSGVLPAPSSQFSDSELDGSPLQPPKDCEKTEYAHRIGITQKANSRRYPLKFMIMDFSCIPG